MKPIDDGVPSPSRWQRLMVWLKDAEEALSTTSDDIRDRRIAKLETDVRALQSSVVRGDLAAHQIDDARPSESLSGDHAIANL